MSEHKKISPQRVIDLLKKVAPATQVAEPKYSGCCTYTTSDGHSYQQTMDSDECASLNGFMQGGVNCI
jgi:hypothetical protein